MQNNFIVHIQAEMNSKIQESNKNAWRMLGFHKDFFSYKYQIFLILCPRSQLPLDTSQIQYDTIITFLRSASLIFNMADRADMARTFEFVLHFVECVTVTVSPNQIIIIIIIIMSRI